MPGRRHKRHVAKSPIPVGFLGSNVRFVGDMVDISANGILVRCTNDLEVGMVGILGFEVGNDVFRASVVVRRRVPGTGLAFGFLQMTSADRQALNSMLLRLSRQA